MRCNVVYASTVWACVKKLEKLYQNDNLKEGDTLILKIDNPTINDLPIQHFDVYKRFFGNLNEGWKSDSVEFYYSFKRRLMDEENLGQFEKGIVTLLNNEKSRRCVLCANRPSDSIDYRPALVAITFSIHDDKLKMNVHWRSQEIFYALPINLIQMFSIMNLFVNKLKSKYHNLQMGEYVQYIDNVCIHDSINKNNTNIIQMWKSIDIELNQELKFLWSIVFKNKEAEYDGNY